MRDDLADVIKFNVAKIALLLADAGTRVPRSKDDPAAGDLAGPAWIALRLAHLLRNLEHSKEYLLTGATAIDILHLLVEAEPAAALEADDTLDHYIRAVYNFVYLPDDPFWADLKAKAEEMLHALQTKVATTAYANAFGRVKTAAEETRVERRAKRAVAVINNPAAAVDRKRRKHEKARQAKKLKSGEHRMRRLNR
ncbi:uncharacterized protein V1510DRAFT_421549 [Dipodascopsis tothii]|uniref:uncharacterized protein n=1 Tax=Dipodascopsis tothii TaxID=44089 RepID=UPI0034CD04CA